MMLIVTDPKFESQAASPAGATSDVFLFLKRKKGASLSIEERSTRLLS